MVPSRTEFVSAGNGGVAFHASATSLPQSHADPPSRNEKWAATERETGSTLISQVFVGLRRRFISGGGEPAVVKLKSLDAERSRLALNAVFGRRNLELTIASIYRRAGVKRAGMDPGR